MTRPPGPVLGVDVGGTTVKAAVVAPGGELLSLATRASAEQGGVTAWLQASLDAAAEALRLSAEPPVTTGLSVPGAVDPVAVKLIDLVDRLPSAEGLDLAAAFAPLGLPVSADNDARAALAAERLWGGPNRADDVVVLTLGTGIGGAARIGGRTPGGEPVLAGNQLGHLTIDLNGERCTCGNRGCAETIASGSALVAAAHRAGLRVSDASDVFSAASIPDERAARIVERFITGLVATIVNAIHAYQPSTVVLSGGVMGSADHFLPAVQAAVTERAWTLPRGRVCVEASRLGNSAGVLAGAAIALRRERRAARLASSER